MKFTGVKQGEIPEWDLAFPREPLERPKWEYMTYVIGGEHPVGGKEGWDENRRKLAEYGDNGWEMYQVFTRMYGYQYFFKRPIGRQYLYKGGLCSEGSFRELIQREKKWMAEHPGELTPLDLRTLWEKEHPDKKYPLARQDLDFRERMRITFEETDWLEDRKETVREKDSGMEY